MRFQTYDKSSRGSAFKQYFAPTKISENIRKTPEGFLLCVGVPIARTGEMVYGKDETPLEPGPDGKVIISREEKEVFAPETIASFEGKPVTITHPEDFVDPTNWKDLTKGILQNVRRGEGAENMDLIADLLIMDAFAINEIESGLREVSCGYEAEYVQTGIGRGVQKSIIGNHLALVDQGRAGSSYAINDHKIEGEKNMTWQDKIKAIFAKAQDEAMKVRDAEEKKEEKKEEKVSGDSMGAGYDDLVKICNSILEKVGGGQKDAKPPGEAGAPVEKDAKAGGEQVQVDEKPDMETRMKKMEDAFAEMQKSKDAEKEEKSEDADEEEKESEDSGDDDFEEGPMAKDTADSDTTSRAEILAPGIKATKDVKAQALQAAYQTKDGKRVIDAISGGKPDFKTPATVDTLFIAASEVLKVERTKDFSKTKQTRDSEMVEGTGTMTPEKINEINAKHYGLKK